MISNNYVISEFVKAIMTNDNYIELLKITDEEVAQAERRVAPGRHGAPKERERGCYEYIRELKGFLFFLRNGTRPAGTYNFDYFYPVCQNLIDKKVFKPEAMEAFFK